MDENTSEVESEIDDGDLVREGKEGKCEVCMTRLFFFFLFSAFRIVDAIIFLFVQIMLPLTLISKPSPFCLRALASISSRIQSIRSSRLLTAK